MGRVVAVGRVGEAEFHVLRDGNGAGEEDLAVEEGAQGGERLLRGLDGGGDWCCGCGERAVKRVKADGAAKKMASLADHFESG